MNNEANLDAVEAYFRRSRRRAQRFRYAILALAQSFFGSMGLVVALLELDQGKTVVGYATLSLAVVCWLFAGWLFWRAFTLRM